MVTYSSHLCESVDVEKVITTLQDNPDGSDGTGNDHCSKLETIVQLHYELVTEFYLSIVLSLAHSFFSGQLYRDIQSYLLERRLILRKCSHCFLESEKFQMVEIMNALITMF